ncbi:helix-turn-helix domain-containing protein [Nocardioides sp.]|uniref:helix-turn-helix domain-containing protein n=1 Tax=Nocardioides sp. TaxID=35761 RepID=UPI003513BD3D
MEEGSRDEGGRDEVRALRTAAGLTQAELAARAGVAQPNIAAYESGRRRASSATIARLRRAAAPRPGEALATHRTALIALAARHGLTQMRVFGSVRHGSDAPGSDVDLLVAAAPGTGLVSVAAFALAAEDLLGVPVDVVTEGALRPDHPIRLEALAL